ncbi:MAG: ABC transporter ATP-binding protein [Lachnospiraceae bacterium]|nr:ABC transporter ATP-binding protein [Lachnospiraceae bacterium]
MKKKLSYDLVLTIAYAIKVSVAASPFYFIIRVCKQLLIPITTFVSAFMLKELIDSLSKRKENFKYIVFLSLGIFLISILGLIVQKISDYVSLLHEELIKQRLSDKIMAKAQSMDMKFFDNPEYYDVITRSRWDIQAVSNMVWNLMDACSALVTAIGAAIVVLKVNWIFVALLILVTSPASLVDRFYTKKLFDFNMENMKEERQRDYLFSISMDKNYAGEMRLYQFDNIIRKKFIKLWRCIYDKRKKIYKKQYIILVAVNLLPELLMGIILLVIARSVWVGIYSIGEYSLYSGMLSSLTSGILYLFSSFIRIYDNKLRVDNIRKFFGYKNVIENIGKKRITEIEKIEFRNVSFSYPGTGKMIINHVNFKIKKGDKVAIVGLNGAGKSTLIKLLFRLYDVVDGAILVNDYNIKEYEINSYRDRFASYFQKNVNYGFSLRDNVILSKKNAVVSDEEIKDILNKCEAEDILKSVDGNLDTYIGRNFESDGIQLSGGQEQKLALARAFYRNAEALVLDEPSAYLDPEAEYKIFKIMAKMTKGKTVIFTSHRLSNVVTADYILVLENGEIIEKGTHNELISKSGRYAELFNYQAERYTEGNK